MKIRTLLLGSVALAGLSTAGYAADLGVVTSLDVCDELGLSGLTISSDDNCLQISGGVSFEYDYGSYDPSTVLATFANNTGNDYTQIGDDAVIDRNADVDAWLQFVATASTDFGPASATIKLISNDNPGVDTTVLVDSAWVGIGDTTVLMAGYKSSIFNSGDDAPLNYLGLFNSSSVNTGVGFATTGADTGGDVIQVTSNLGNGFKVSAGMENLDVDATFIGVVAYAGDGITGHVSVASDSADWKLHAGFTGTWDPISVVGAFSTDDTGYYDALGSISAKFDMFTLAASGEAASDGVGIGGSLSATVSEGVTVNLGGRYWAGSDDVYQVEAAVSAAVTETITLTAAVGATDSTAIASGIV